MSNKSHSSKLLILIAICVIAWFGWKQYQVSFPPRNIPDLVHDAFRNVEIEFLSLSPKHPPDNPNAELFHGFEILGSMKIDDRSTRTKMIDSLDRAVGENEITTARCYWPRHGVRCKHNGDEIEIIVCFECAPLTIYLNGESIYSSDVSKTPKELFDKILQAEHLPINAAPW